jgi:hypothetical protein
VEKKEEEGHRTGNIVTKGENDQTGMQVKAGESCKT